MTLCCRSDDDSAHADDADTYKDVYDAPCIVVVLLLMIVLLMIHSVTAIDMMDNYLEIMM